MAKWPYPRIKNLVKIYSDFDVNANYENETDVLSETFIKLKLTHWTFPN